MSPHRAHRQTMPLPEGALGDSIFVVDDEPELLRLLRSTLTETFGEGRVRATADPKEAAAWLALEHPALLVTDLRMPEVSGADLVELLFRRFGPTPVVIVTAADESELRRFALGPSIGFLRKPFDPAALIELATEKLRPRPHGFTGEVAVTMLADVIQLYGLAGGTGRLGVDSPRGHAELWMEDGELVHARCADAQGPDAIRDALAWSHGAFAWHEGEKAPARTLHDGLSQLLLEAFAAIDEAPLGGSKLAANAHVADGEHDPAVTLERRDAEAYAERMRAIAGALAAGVIARRPEPILAGWSQREGLDLETIAEEARGALGLHDRAMAELGLAGERVEDAWLTSTGFALLAHACERHPGVAFFLLLDRGRANLGLARMQLGALDRATRED